MKRILAVLLLIMVFVINNFALSAAPQKTIGIIISTLNNPFFVVLAENAERRAKELGYRSIVLDCQNDPVSEANNVEDLIAQKVDIVLYNTVESNAAVSSVKKLNAAKIPVVCLDRAIPGGTTALFLTSDNVLGGEMAGEYLAKRLNYKGNVIQLEGILGISATVDRGEGFTKAMKKYPGIKILTTQTANFDRGQRLQVMENLIQAYGKQINGVFAQNDEMALGAVRALAAANMLDKVVVVGYDGIEDALRAVKNKQLAATVAQRFDLLGIRAVEYADKILKKEKVPAAVSLEVALVTLENVDEYLAPFAK